MVDGKEVELAVVKPNAKVIQESQFFYGKVFAEALKNGCLLRVKLEEYVKEQGVWSDERTEQLRKFDKIISDGALALKKGGIKKSAAKVIAINMRNARNERTMLLAERFALAANTAEGRADNARFSYQVYLCLVYNETGDRVFASYDDYLTAISEEYVVRANEIFSNLVYDMDDDFDLHLPENEFLRKWKFVDNKMRLINEKGNLVDEEGKVVDDRGNYVAEEKLEDIVTQPFLDDSGKPIVEDKKVV